MSKINKFDSKNREARRVTALKRYYEKKGVVGEKNGTSNNTL